MKYYIKAIKNYAVFSGRTTRMEFWMFMLFNCLVALAIGVTVGIIATVANMDAADNDYFARTMSNLYVLFILLPTVSILVRRLHDIGRNGWYCLLAFIPVVGVAAMIVIGMLDTEPFPNEYGPSSKIGEVNVLYDEESPDDVIELKAEIVE